MRTTRVRVGDSSSGWREKQIPFGNDSKKNKGKSRAVEFGIDV